MINCSVCYGFPIIGLPCPNESQHQFMDKLYYDKIGNLQVYPNDTKMLDWLEKQGFVEVHDNHDNLVFFRVRDSKSGDETSLREEIRKAMNGT